ncbi:YdaS family helix-turn-helix protein [Sinorhizobium sp. 22678]|uniref:YdaS family helix-turn-helix protein n=1 Tax=Sinorhizobium sp. 22678 TaxID=3453955 RepID=UPI003F87378D
METLLTYLKAERGRLSRLADALAITPAAIKQWAIVPADKLIAIEAATGIPRQVLRPDLYEGMRRTPRARMEVAQ